NGVAPAIKMPTARQIAVAVELHRSEIIRRARAPAIVRHLWVLPFISKLAACEASIGAAANSTVASRFAVTRQRNDKKALISSSPLNSTCCSVLTQQQPVPRADFDAR